MQTVRRRQDAKVPVNFILDEFNNIGKLGEAQRTDRTSRAHSASFEAVPSMSHMAVQSLGQLQNRYPNNLWAEIIGNVDVQLMLGCTDDITADFFSERSGDMSIEVNSTMTVRQTIAVAQVIPQYRHTEGQGKRRLLTPDEVLRLPNEELLVIIRGHNILKLSKFDFTNHPMSKEIVRTSIVDYHPTPVFLPPPQTDTVQEQATEWPAEKKRKPLYSSAAPPSEF
jgi:type IV secretion system protein VirD4